MTYRAPVADIAFTLKHIAGFPQLIERGLFEDLDMDTSLAILEEAARFANEELARHESGKRRRAGRSSLMVKSSCPKASRKPIASGSMAAGEV